MDVTALGRPSYLCAMSVHARRACPRICSICGLGQGKRAPHSVQGLRGAPEKWAATHEQARGEEEGVPRRAYWWSAPHAYSTLHGCTKEEVGELPSSARSGTLATVGSPVESYSQLRILILSALAGQKLIK